MSETTRAKLESHYERDATVYDFNRRFFLFGRNAILSSIKKQGLNPASILEVGCGTGRNLLILSKLFPRAKLTGIDLSADMLAIAADKLGENERVTLIREMFDENTDLPKFDLVLFSYALSTIPDLDHMLDLTARTLNDQGHFALVDFHRSNATLFKRWISHSVPIRTHFPEEALDPHFQEKMMVSRRAYLGIWRYFMYIGQKR